MPSTLFTFWQTSRPLSRAHKEQDLGLLDSPSTEDSQMHLSRRMSRLTRPFTILCLVAVGICAVFWFAAYSRPPATPSPLKNFRPPPIFDNSVDDVVGDISDEHRDPPAPMSYNPNDPNTRKAIVFASFTEQDISWFPRIPSDWEVYRYVLDDPNPDYGIPVPRNQGREAMAYLTFIIDHYYNLPNFTVFHHGHHRAWHQPEPTELKLRALNLTALSHDHYINLRCALLPGCTPETSIDVAKIADAETRAHAIILPKFWNTMFGNESMWHLGPPPEALSIPCCAQFAVTREAIHQRPLEFYKSYRKPLEKDLSDYIPVWGEYADSYYVGICYEKLWHMVFGKPAIYCPTENHCRKTQFSDAVACNKYTDTYENSTGWEDIVCVDRWQDG